MQYRTSRILCNQTITILSTWSIWKKRNEM